MAALDGHVRSVAVERARRREREFAAVDGHVRRVFAAGSRQRLELDEGENVLMDALRASFRVVDGTEDRYLLRGEASIA